MSRERYKKIKVFRKDNLVNPIAVFTDSIPAQANNSKEVMINPKVTIEQNSSSTLTFSMFIESQKWQDIKDVENIYEVDGRRYTALNENGYEYQGDIVNVNLVETWYLLSKQFVQAYNTPKEREGIDEYTVVLLPKSTEPLVINGVQYSDSQVPYPRGSAGYNLWAILKDTNWKLGTCDVIVDGFSPADDYGVFNVESDMKDVLENIRLVQSLYGGILVFDSINNIVHLRDENKWNNDYGYCIREGKNAKEPVIVRQNNDILTVIYPLGDGNLNIKAVNNNKNYIENYSYTNQKFVGMVQNSDIYDQNQLLFWGQRQLEKVCKPRKEIEASLVDVSTTEEQPFEKFDLNDIVTVYYKDVDTGKTINEKKRVISLSYLVFAPYNCDVSVGDKAQNVKEILKQVFKKSEIVKNTINSVGGISGNNIYLNSVDGFEGFNLTNYASGVNGTLLSYGNSIHLHDEKITETSRNLADFQLYATETYATITATTQAINETKEYASNAVANLQLYVDGDFATATLGAAYDYTDKKTSEVSSALAEFTAYADETYATITALSEYRTQSEKYTTDAVAGLQTYVDGDFSQATLSAAYRSATDYTDTEVGKVSSSLADFELYADDTYATTRQFSDFKEEVDGELSGFSATIETMADDMGSAIELTNWIQYPGGPKVRGTYLEMTGSYIHLIVEETGGLSINGTSCHLGITGGSTTIRGYPIYIGTSDTGYVSILGSRVKFNSAGVLCKA